MNSFKFLKQIEIHINELLFIVVCYYSSSFFIATERECYLTQPIFFTKCHSFRFNILVLFPGILRMRKSCIRFTYNLRPNSKIFNISPIHTQWMNPFFQSKINQNWYSNSHTDGKPPTLHFNIFKNSLSKWYQSINIILAKGSYFPFNPCSIFN